jgi:hypothetical protein
VNFLPPTVNAPPPEPLNTVPDEAFPEDVAVTRADDSMGVGFNAEDLADCWTVGECIIIICLL